MNLIPNLSLAINGSFDPENRFEMYLYGNKFTEKMYKHNFQLTSHYKFNGKEYKLVKENLFNRFSKKGE